ncbi:MAG: Hpt domain-containing protein, partial [Alphaproteobacteria bacterium]
DDVFVPALAELHAIKGAAGNLGAVELFEAARNLEQGMKSGASDPWPALFDRFEKSLKRLRSSVSVLEEPAPVPPPAPASETPPPTAQDLADPEVVRNLMDELSRQIFSGDIRMEDTVARLREALGIRGQRPDVEKLSRQIEDFDILAAADSLAALAQDLGFSS